MPAATKTETVEISHWATGRMLFSCEVEAGLSDSLKIGAAVKIAFKAGARLDGARLVGARLDGARLDGASLDGAILVGASLDGARLDGARLDGARLVGASLDGAILVGASLVGARLVGASLVGARLDGAILDGARLDGASLVGARIVGARLDGARLDGARDILDCGTPHGWRVVVVKHKDGIRIAAGCRWFTFSAAVEHWTGRSDRQLMLPLLTYIRAACEINGWALDDAPKSEG